MSYSPAELVEIKVGRKYQCTFFWHLQYLKKPAQVSVTGDKPGEAIAAARRFLRGVPPS